MADLKSISGLGTLGLSISRNVLCSFHFDHQLFLVTVKVGCVNDGISGNIA